MVAQTKGLAFRLSAPATRRLLSLLAFWRNRARERRALSRLDDRLLSDIGLNRDAAARESSRRFWQD